MTDASGTRSAPVVLVDAPWDGVVEEFGWVEAACATEDEARQRLSEFTVNDDCNPPEGFRPGGPAKRVWLGLDNPDADPEEQSWTQRRSGEDGAVEFWQIDCTVAVAKKG